MYGFLKVICFDLGYIIVGGMDFELFVIKILLLILFFVGIGVGGGLVLVLVLRNEWVVVIGKFEFKGLLERKGCRVLLGLLLLLLGLENYGVVKFIVLFFIFSFVSVIVEFGFIGLLVGVGFFDMNGCIVGFLFLFFFNDGLLFRLKFIVFFFGGCGGGCDCSCVVLLLLWVDDFSFFMVFCKFIDNGI